MHHSARLNNKGNVKLLVILMVSLILLSIGVFVYKSKETAAVNPEVEVDVNAETSLEESANEPEPTNIPTPSTTKTPIIKRDIKEQILAQTHWVKTDIDKLPVTCTTTAQEATYIKLTTEIKNPKKINYDSLYQQITKLLREERWLSCNKIAQGDTYMLEAFIKNGKHIIAERNYSDESGYFVTVYIE